MMRCKFHRGRGTQAVDASTAVPISIRNKNAASKRPPSSRTCAAASRHVDWPDRPADKGEQEKSEPIAIDTGGAGINCYQTGASAAKLSIEARKLLEWRLPKTLSTEAMARVVVRAVSRRQPDPPFLNRSW